MDSKLFARFAPREEKKNKKKTEKKNVNAFGLAIFAHFLLFFNYDVVEVEVRQSQQVSEYRVSDYPLGGKPLKPRTKANKKLIVSSTFFFIYFFPGDHRSLSIN